MRTLLLPLFLFSLGLVFLMAGWRTHRITCVRAMDVTCEIAEDDYLGLFHSRFHLTQVQAAELWTARNHTHQALLTAREGTLAVSGVPSRVDTKSKRSAVEAVQRYLYDKDQTHLALALVERDIGRVGLGLCVSSFLTLLFNLIWVSAGRRRESPLYEHRRIRRSPL